MSRSQRYRTPIPFAAQVSRDEYLRRDIHGAPHKANQDKPKNGFSDNMNRKVSFRSNGELAFPPPKPDLIAENSLGSGFGIQTAVLADSWLPYTRPARTDLQRLTAELDLSSDSDSPGANQDLSLGKIPSTGSSGESQHNSSSKSSGGNSTDLTTPGESPEKVLQGQTSYVASPDHARSYSTARAGPNYRPELNTLANHGRPAAGESQTSNAKSRARSSSSKRRMRRTDQAHVASITPVVPMSPRRVPHVLLREQTPSPTYVRHQNLAELSPIFDRDFESRPVIPRVHRGTEDTAQYYARVESTTSISNGRKSSQSVRNARPKTPLPAKPSTRVVSPVVSERPRLVIKEHSTHTSYLYSDTSPTDDDESETEGTYVSPRDLLRRHEDRKSRKLRLTSASNEQFVSRPRERSISQRRSPSTWRPPSVWYEHVDGVTLSTRPKKAAGNHDGLSIPEIEARDIQTIPIRGRQIIVDSELESQFVDRRRHHAPSPPPVGIHANETRIISPRAVEESRDHIFVDHYSRAGDTKPAQRKASTELQDETFLDHYAKLADDEMHGQRANPPRSRGSESNTIRPTFSIPEAIPEASSTRSESLSDIESVGAAEPPNVAMTRSLAEQDADLKNRADHVKSMLGGMLKTIAGKDRRTGTRQSVDQTRPRHGSLSATSNPRGKQERVVIKEMDAIFWDDSDAESEESRPNTMIWSPGEAGGRRSVDTRDSRSRTSHTHLDSERNVYSPTPSDSDTLRGVFR